VATTGDFCKQNGKQAKQGRFFAWKAHK